MNMMCLHIVARSVTAWKEMQFAVTPVSPSYDTILILLISNIIQVQYSTVQYSTVHTVHTVQYNTTLHSQYNT